MSDFYKELELARKNCTKKQREFALSMASGLTKEAAYMEVYGPKCSKNRYYHSNRALEMLDGPAGKYLGLLMSPMNNRIMAPYILKRAERLSLLSMGAVLAYERAEKQDDTKSLNHLVRCINEINRMTGDHAPDQLEVKGHVLHAAINSSMSEEEATELYKQSMKGARLALEHEEKKENAAPALIEYEPVVRNER